jgi:hypothetical protein
MSHSSTPVTGLCAGRRWEAPETRKLRDYLSRQPQPVTTEPKIIRWQAEPERRAACGPSTGSGAAAILNA